MWINERLWSEQYLVPCSFSAYEQAGYMHVESLVVYIVGKMAQNVGMV